MYWGDLMFKVIMKPQIKVILLLVLIRVYGEGKSLRQMKFYIFETIGIIRTLILHVYESIDVARVFILHVAVTIDITRILLLT